MRQIIVHQGKSMTKIAVTDHGRLMEYLVERPVERQRAGNIYIGKVINILPGMQAAFLDIGTDKNAFLYIDDLLPAFTDKQSRSLTSIEKLLVPGQKLLVQVMKEAVGKKGARVTTHCALPGRHLVYLPLANYIGVSRKIEAESERQRLKTVGEQIRHPDEGLIIRTVAAGEHEEALVAELEELRSAWADLRARAEQTTAPALIYQDLDMLPRLVRDLLTDQVESIVIDDESARREIIQLIEGSFPHFTQKVKLYDGNVPVFDHYSIHEQLDQLFRRKIWLESGAYIIVEQTEALTVIDVNTGKYTGSVNLEQTVFATNLEAAAEIARIIRVRNLSGIILIDFIDMEEEMHRRQIIEELERWFKQDQIKTLAVGWTKLGLLEVTRKKVRESLDEQFYVLCSHCQGKGKVYHPH